jgi:hypothetical protein
MMSTAPSAFASRDLLRSQTGVQLVKSENEGFALAKQPSGTYGFSYAPLEECPVFSRQSFQVFEVQKRADGSRWVAAYVTPEHESLIAGDQEPIEVFLYPETYEKATQLVVVQLERVIKKKSASRIDGNYIQVTLAKM